jgi:hypothetical protein
MERPEPPHLLWQHVARSATIYAFFLEYKLTALGPTPKTTPKTTDFAWSDPEDHRRTRRTTEEQKVSETLDTQLPFWYFQPTQNRVLINLGFVGLNPSGGMHA